MLMVILILHKKKNKLDNRRQENGCEDYMNYTYTISRYVSYKTVTQAISKWIIKV